MTEDGLLMVAEELGKVQSYQENNTLVVDLPLLQNIFAKPNVKAIVQKLNQTFKFDNIKWPLWKVRLVIKVLCSISSKLKNKKKFTKTNF